MVMEYIIAEYELFVMRVRIRPDRLKRVLDSA